MSTTFIQGLALPGSQEVAPEGLELKLWGLASQHAVWLYLLVEGVPGPMSTEQGNICFWVALPFSAAPG